MKKQSITALRVKFLAPTNSRNPRLKFIQLNNLQECTIEQIDNLTTLEQIEHVLKACPCLKNWFVIVDNTQQNSYLIGLEYNKNNWGFCDVIIEIKDNEKRSK